MDLVVGWFGAARDSGEPLSLSVQHTISLWHTIKVALTQWIQCEVGSVEEAAGYHLRCT